MLYQHFARPSGWMGKLAGRFMEKENEKLNAWTLSFLDLQKGEEVLEIGCGAGEALEQASRIQGLHLYALDPSEVMVETVLHKWRSFNNAAQVGVIHGQAEDLVHFHRAMDKVYAVNNVTFWEDPEEILAHLYTNMNQNGRIALTLRPHEEGAGDDTTHILGGQMKAMLVQAGFRDVCIHIRPEKPNKAVCVTGMV